MIFLIFNELWFIFWSQKSKTYCSPLTAPCLQNSFVHFSPSIEGFSWRIGSNPRCHSKNREMKYNTHINLCINYMVHVFSAMWRIKNQSSNFISWNDNAVRLLVLVTGILYGGLQMTSSFSIWGCVLKGCFERGIFWRAKSRLKGIEDFNLEQWYWCKGTGGIYWPIHVRSLRRSNDDDRSCYWHNSHQKVAPFLVV